jgi:hypothetical protein
VVFTVLVGTGFGQVVNTVLINGTRGSSITVSIYLLTINQDKSTTPATLLCCFVVQFFAHTTTECYTRAFFFLFTPSVRAPAHKLASLLGEVIMDG